MNLKQTIKLAEKHSGQRTPGKKNQFHWYGHPLVEKVVPFRFWREKDRDAFVLELPDENFRAQGPCDEAECYWVYAKPDDVIGKAHWENEHLPNGGNLVIDEGEGEEASLL